MQAHIDSVSAYSVLPLEGIEASPQRHTTLRFVKTLRERGNQFRRKVFAVADPNPQQLYTPSTSDDPTHPQHPVSSSSAVLSAPNTAQTSGTPQLSLSSSTDQTPAGTPLPPAFPPRQDPRTGQHRRTIGRRQRSASEEGEDEEGQAGTEAGEFVSSSTIRPSGSRTPARKRRRTNMLSDIHDGPGSSNGTSGVVANGTIVPQRISSNGTSRNGSDGLNGSSQNGKEPARPPQPATYFGHDRGEMTRLLIQALTDMGYQEAAQSVSKDSGVELESPTVAAFRTAVLEGYWTRAESLLDGALLAGEDQRKGNGLVLSFTAERNNMKFWLKQQKYLELLEQQESGRALIVLRTELAPLCQEKVLHTLASLLMCQSPDDLRLKARWDGANGQSRHDLLSQLSRSSHPSRTASIS